MKDKEKFWKPRRYPIIELTSCGFDDTIDCEFFLSGLRANGLSKEVCRSHLSRDLRLLGGQLLDKRAEFKEISSTEWSS